MSVKSLGLIPVSWLQPELSELVTVHYGKSLSAAGRNSSGSFPVVGSSGVVDRHDEYLVEGPCLVVGRKGAAGSVHLLRQSSWPIDTAYFIQPPSEIHLHYLSYLLGSLHLVQLDKSTAIPSLGRDDLHRVKVPLPPRAEQTRIVTKIEELLSDLDAGVTELKAAQKKLAQYRQSLLKAAVEGALTAQWREEQRKQKASTETGAQLLARILQERRTRWEAKQLAKFKEQGKTPPKDWQKKYPEPVQPDTTGLPELPQGWVWASVEQLSLFVRNGISKTPNTAGKGFSILRINAVRSMAVQFAACKHIELSEAEAEDYFIEDGDLLATRYNGSVDLLGVIGLVRGAPEKMLHPDKLIRMKPVISGCLGPWIELAANTGSSRVHIVGRVKTTAGQTGISGEDLRKMPIPLPPLDEQAVGAFFVDEGFSALRQQTLALEVALKQSTAQRQNILRAAFTGRLVPQDPDDEPASALLARIRAERAARDAVKRPRGGKTRGRV